MSADHRFGASRGGTIFRIITFETVVQADNQRQLDRGTMAAVATSATSLVSRCAVCKIDRKGRFVYLDDQTEKLLGLSQVELFAKPFAEFLDLADHEIIDEITSQFNRYESFYDAAPVTIIDSHGKRIPATVVISLNFAAGNPVNYEIIINTAVPPQPVENRSREKDESQEFLSFLVDVRSPSDSPAAGSAIVEALRNYTDAQAVSLYDTSGETPHLIATAGQHPDDDACELDNSSDAEEVSSHCYKTLLEISQEEEYLLKLTFDDSTIEDQLIQARDRVEQAGILLARVLVTSDEPEPVYTPADTFSLIELLDKMQIGAILFDSEGHLKDHNEKMRHLLPLNAVNCLADFSRQLAENGGADIEAHIHAWFETSDSTTTPPNLELPVRLSSDQPARLTIFRLAPGSEDQSAYCLLFPEEVSGGHGAKASLPLSHRFVQKALERLQASVSAGLTLSQELDHEHRSEMTRDGAFNLNCLSNHLLKIKAVLDDLDHATCFAVEPEQPSVTDLELLVDQIVPEIVTAYPQVKLSLNKASLPRITIEQKKFRTILRDVLTHLVANTSGTKVSINISATVNTKECHLRIKCDGAAIPQSHLEQAFTPAGMGVTGELVSTLGGQLKLAKSGGKGSVLTLTLPIKGI